MISLTFLHQDGHKFVNYITVNIASIVARNQHFSFDVEQEDLKDHDYDVFSIIAGVICSIFQ